MCLFGHKEDKFEDATLNELIRKPSADIIVKNKYKDTRLLIIGAGAAGIACATKLIEFGFQDVQILDAESRIGGRIHTMPFGNNVIDLGARWCHGEEGNIVYKLVKDKNLLGTASDIFMGCGCIRSNGEEVSKTVVDRLKGVLRDIFVTKYDEMRHFPGTLHAYLTKAYYDIIKGPDFEDIEENVATEFLENYMKIESCDDSSDLDDAISAAGFSHFKDCDGDYFLNFKENGYIEFLRVLMKSDKKSKPLGVLDGKIQFDTVVNKINYDREDDMVEVHCNNNTEFFLVHHVIVTVSLGVLKRTHRTLFTPELPAQKIRCIQNLGFGKFCKFFLEFPEKFWPEDWHGFNTLWRQEDAIELRQSKTTAWLEDVYGFNCVSYQPRILVCYLVGKYVEQVESLTKYEIQENCLYLLRRFLPKWKIPEPLDIKVTNWATNPNFCGSYSFRKMATEKFNTSATDLAQPLTVLSETQNQMDVEIDTNIEPDEDARASMQALTVRPIVLFAGEATSPHHYSTVHGAVESGFREASRIDGYYC